MINFEFNWCGKFQSPSNEWMHLTRNLIDYELMVVTHGTLYIANDTKEYTVNKGEYLLMPPTPYQHGFKQGGCDFYWLHFNYNNEKESIFSALSPLTMHGKLSSIERVIVLMKQLQDSDKRYHNDTLNCSLTTAILLELTCQSATYKKENAQNQTKQIFNDITDFIQYHSSENIRVSEIANYFGYNEKYLSTFFKKQSGTSLKQYILQVKMDSAKAELSDTNHTISQIAYNVGYNDAHNFTNAFKKITGLTPSDYRISYGKRALFFE